MSDSVPGVTRRSRVLPGEAGRYPNSCEDLESAVRGLIEKANAHGGPDNITVLLIEL